MMIGKAITKLRVERNITKTQLSEMADISLPSITQYENGNRNPSEANLQKIANVLDVTVSRLKEIAEDIERSFKKSPQVDDYQYKKRIEFIMRHNDIVIELDENILLAFNIRVHDIINDLLRNDRIVTPRNRLPSAFQSTVEKVLRDVIYENLDDIAYRIDDEFKRNGESIKKLVDKIYDEKYRY